VESLEYRQLLATLAPVANQTVGTGVGLQVVLDGGNGNAQTYSVSSSNPNIKVTMAEGNFLAMTVSHTSSGAGDPSFTGTIVFKLFEDLTPQTVERIEQLVASGFYTSPTQPTSGSSLPNKNFHRVVPNFVVQGGSLTGTGAGSFTAPGFPFADEFNQQLVFNGKYQIAMANSGDDTNDTQFFVTLTDTRSLDFNHTIFGQVVAGQDVVNQMAAVAVSGETPVNPILITGTTISAANPDGVIHLNATNADIGQSGTITVTAFDPSDNSQVTRTFQVNVTANVNSAGQPVLETPFLQPVANQVVATNQPAIFQLVGVSAIPNDTLTYTVQGSVTGSGTSKTFAPIPTTQGTATVTTAGVVTFTPANNFTGVVSMVVGVRNNNLKSGVSVVTNPDNFDLQTMTVTVRNGAVVNLAPIAVPQSYNVPANVTTPVQLQGLTANPSQTTQTLTYTIVTQPTNGTISNFNSATGLFNYTPNANFQGTDTLQFYVTDNGDPGPSMNSAVATVKLIVGGSQGLNVRVLDRVLLISAPPIRKGTNEIYVERVNDTIRVSINGIFAAAQPAVSAVDRIVVYGSKANDGIAIDPDLPQTATINGGRGGLNTLRAGSVASRLHGWFGLNYMVGGDEKDQLIGRQRHVRVGVSSGGDLVFLGQGALSKKRGFPAYPTSSWAVRPGAPPTGRFYRQVGDKLVPISTPKLTLTRKDAHRVGTSTTPRNP
jgi:cyclophilin family peptidyl-prolyl cis-trans isomerase